MNSPNSLAPDLDLILSRTEPLWQELRGGRIFITGGTGFFGRWLLESFAWANRLLELKAEAVVLTRNLSAFQKAAPNLAADPAIRFHAGDVRGFIFPAGKFSHVIHGATAASATLNAGDPQLMFDTIAQGTRQALDFAAQAGAKKFLFISSGAVYGRQPPGMSHLAEDFIDAVDKSQPLSAYAEGKRAGEELCAAIAKSRGLEIKIARGFAFVGPHLPLDAHFAIGNFIRDGLAGQPIRVSGDGTPFRSYLYSADLAIWLWTILFHGLTARPYNVGSEEALSIADLAGLVARTFKPALPVQIAKPAVQDQLIERYVPATRRAAVELGLRQNIPLAEAVRRTIRWHECQKTI